MLHYNSITFLVNGWDHIDKNEKCYKNLISIWQTAKSVKIW